MKNYLAWALLAVLVAVTLARNEVWVDEGKTWEDIIQKSPRKARAYNELGLHLLDIGDHAGALRVLGRSMALNPYQPQVYINLGLAFEKTNQVEQAINAYERAMSYQPDDPTAYYNLGVLTYNTLKDRNKALGYFLQARDLNPLEPDVHQFLGQIYAERGNTALSREEMALYDRLKHKTPSLPH
jgi:tetratricopeptide (TPR) repeat protein